IKNTDNQSSEKYIESLYAEDADLQRAEEAIRSNGMPQISIAPGYGRLLSMLVRMNGVETALEVGALGGYSGICISRGLAEGGKLISLEIDANFAQVAREQLE